jgi:hypothetical protein
MRTTAPPPRSVADLAAMLERHRSTPLGEMHEISFRTAQEALKDLVRQTTVFTFDGKGFVASGGHEELAQAGIKEVMVRDHRRGDHMLPVDESGRFAGASIEPGTVIELDLRHEHLGFIGVWHAMVIPERSYDVGSRLRFSGPGEAPPVEAPLRGREAVLAQRISDGTHAPEQPLSSRRPAGTIAPHEARATLLKK